MAVRKRGSRRVGAAKRAANKDDAAEVTPTSIATASYDEVLAAIVSLYEDELKPFGRILRKRVSELAAVELGAVLRGSEAKPPDVDVRHLKSICEESDRIIVGPEEGGDWSALIIDRPQSFIDVYSPRDVYPADMWQAMAAFFTDHDTPLPGGRYSCAQALQELSPPFLDGRSLGQVCHIVQLAMSRKKILGYSNGAVVPYSKSQCAMKEQCAMQAMAVGGSQADAAASSALPMATWENARHCLHDILENHWSPGAQGEHTVPLSNVKRLFRAKYEIELSETMLGHSKLSDLLQDAQFSDICTVRLVDHGYIVVRVPAIEDKPSSTVSIDSEPLRVDLSSDESLKKLNWPSLPAWLPESGCLGSLVQRTFIHASLPPPTPPPNARPRSHSLPRFETFGSAFDKFDQAATTDSTVDSDQGSARWHESSDDQRESQKRSDIERFASDDFFELGEGEVPDFAEAHEPPQRCVFCPDEPLALEEADIFPNANPLAWNLPSLSPALLDGCVGSISLAKVHNTFIHSPLLPPTPLRVGAARRSRSLPKNVGSDKNAWEAACQALGRGPAQGTRSVPVDSGSGFTAGDCGPTPSVYGGYTRDLHLPVDCEGGFNAGDCGPTPSVYGGYGGREMPCSPYVPGSPAYVPPSPALTASPTYCRPYSLAPRKLHLADATSSPSPKSGNDGLATAESRVISLATLI